MNEHEFRELSAGHALGALSPDDERSYAAALAAHPEWLTIADEDAETAAALGERLPAVAPPAALRAQILSAISQTPQTTETAPNPAAPQLPADAALVRPAAPATPSIAAAPSAPTTPPAEPAPTSAQDLAAAWPGAATQWDDTDEDSDALDAAFARRRKWRRGVFALVASVALLSMVALGTSSFFQALSTPAEITALQRIETAPDAGEASTAFAGGVATVHWSETLGKAVFVAQGLPQLDDERAFELWFVRGETPISAGTFTSSNGLSVTLLDGDLRPGDLVAVTVEDAGGSPTGLPTTDPILAIATA